MCAPIGRTLATDDTFCIGMNWRLVHSLNVNGGQRGLSRDESGRYGRESHVPQRRTTGSPSCREAEGDRAAIVSRGSHVPPGRSGEPVAGQRAVGETGQKCRRVQGRVMRQSSLIPKAMTCFLWKAELRHTAKSGAKKRQSLSCKCHFQYPLQAITKRQKRQSLSESALDSKVCPKVIFALPSKARVLLQIGPLFKRIRPLFQDMSIQDNTKKKPEKAKSFAVRQSMPCVADDTERVQSGLGRG